MNCDINFDGNFVLNGVKLDMVREHTVVGRKGRDSDFNEAQKEC